MYNYKESWVMWTEWQTGVDPNQTAPPIGAV